MGILSSPDRWQQFCNADRTEGDVHHVNGHEVKLCVYDGFAEPTPRKIYKCWRCELRGDDVSDFKNFDCHDCDCEYCPKEKT